MMTKNRELAAPLGLFCLSISVVAGNIAPGFIPGQDFLEGLFAGLALGLSAVGVVVHVFARG
jgi:hypothetical protein